MGHEVFKVIDSRRKGGSERGNIRAVQRRGALLFVVLSSP